MIEEKLRNTETRLAQCEDDRLKIWQRLAEQSGQDVSEIKGDE